MGDPPYSQSAEKRIADVLRFTAKDHARKVQAAVKAGLPIPKMINREHLLFMEVGHRLALPYSLGAKAAAKDAGATRITETYDDRGELSRDLQELARRAVRSFCLTTDREYARAMEAADVAGQTAKVAKRAQARAKLLGVAEASAAYHEGQRAEDRMQGAVGYEWQVSGKPCRKCLQLDGRKVPINRAFATTRARNPQYATCSAPPLHPRCKCRIKTLRSVPEKWDEPLTLV